MQPNKSVEEIVQRHLEEVQDEYNMGGLSDGLYGNYATEVAKRTVNTVLQGVVEMVGKLKQKELEYTKKPSTNTAIRRMMVRRQSRKNTLDEVSSLLNDQIISNEEKK